MLQMIKIMNPVRNNNPMKLKNIFNITLQKSSTAQAVKFTSALGGLFLTG